MNRRTIRTSVRVILFTAFLLSITTLASAQVNGTIEKVWIEYGVKSKGEVGIRIHSKFSVKGALKTGCVIKATVERTNGRPIRSESNIYATKDGKAAVSKQFTPPYGDANYADTKLFLPYWALDMSPEDPNKMRVLVVLTAHGKEFTRSLLDFGFALGKPRPI